MMVGMGKGRVETPRGPMFPYSSESLMRGSWLERCGHMDEPGELSQALPPGTLERASRLLEPPTRSLVPLSWPVPSLPLYRLLAYFLRVGAHG